MAKHTVELTVSLTVRATAATEEDAEDELSTFLVWLMENQDLPAHAYESDREIFNIIETNLSR